MSERYMQAQQQQQPRDRRTDRKSSRCWRLGGGGYLLMEASRVLGGPYPEIALVFGPQLAQSAARVGRPGRPRTRAAAAGGEPAAAAGGVDVTSAWWPAAPGAGGAAASAAPAAVGDSPAPGAEAAPAPLGPAVLLLTAPRDAADQFAEELVQRLVAAGHALEHARERVLVAHGAFDPSMVNAALLSPAAAQAFLRDWLAGRVPQLQLQAGDAGAPPPPPPAGGQDDADDSCVPSGPRG